MDYVVGCIGVDIVVHTVVIGVDDVVDVMSLMFMCCAARAVIVVDAICVVTVYDEGDVCVGVDDCEDGDDDVDVVVVYIC